jgi:hypothetical protein
MLLLEMYCGRDAIPGATFIYYFLLWYRKNATDGATIGRRLISPPTFESTKAGLREHVVFRSEEPKRRNRCTFGGSYIPKLR